MTSISLLSGLKNVPPSINEWKVCNIAFGLRKRGEKEDRRSGTSECCWGGVSIIDDIASEESSSEQLTNESHSILSHN